MRSFSTDGGKTWTQFDELLVQVTGYSDPSLEDPELVFKFTYEGMQTDGVRDGEVDVEDGATYGEIVDHLRGY